MQVTLIVIEASGFTTAPGTTRVSGICERLPPRIYPVKVCQQERNRADGRPTTVAGIGFHGDSIEVWSVGTVRPSEVTNDSTLFRTRDNM
jgi:hypothetical protein